MLTTYCTYALICFAFSWEETEGVTVPDLLKTLYKFPFEVIIILVFLKLTVINESSSFGLWFSCLKEWESLTFSLLKQFEFIQFQNLFSQEDEEKDSPLF